MKVFISAPREKRFFIRCVKEVAEERCDKSVYPPDSFRNLDDKQILEKVIRELRSSHLVLMDLSMKNLNGVWYPNSGVMIEFGLLLRDPTKGLSSAYFFCDESTGRSHIPPMIPRIEVQQYTEGDQKKFKQTIRTCLEDFEKKAPERLRLALEAQTATETMYETKKATSN